MRSNSVFHDLVNEFIWLADQGEYVPRTTISKILDDGKDVFQYLEYVLVKKPHFSILELTKERDFYLEVLIRQNQVREKHATAKRNGILFLLNACHVLEDKELFDAYQNIKIQEYQGKFTIDEMDKLKDLDVRGDEINYY